MEPEERATHGCTHDGGSLGSAIQFASEMNSDDNKASGRRGFVGRRPRRTASLLLLWAQSTEGEGDVPKVDGGATEETLRGLKRTFGNGEPCRGYHLNLSTQIGCVNDGNYPPQWTSPAEINQMFYDQVAVCCEFFFAGKDCVVDNVCEDDDASDNADTDEAEETAPTAPASGACIHGYHFAIDTQDGCTNDGNYPPQWTESERLDVYFFDSGEDCCGKFFPNNKDCVVDNVCGDGGAPDNSDTDEAGETAPTAPAIGEACILGYHFAIDTEDGCTNDGNYPPQWTYTERMIDEMFFDSAMDCCWFFFKHGGCEVYNVCEDEVCRFLVELCQWKLFLFVSCPCLSVAPDFVADEGECYR